MTLIKFEIEVEDREARIIADMIENIDQWYETSLRSLIESSKIAMIDRWMPELLKDDEVTSIPKKKDDIIDLILSRTYYKNAYERNWEKTALESSNFKVE